MGKQQLTNGVSRVKTANEVVNILDAGHGWKHMVYGGDTPLHGHQDYRDKGRPTSVLNLCQGHLSLYEEVPTLVSFLIALSIPSPSPRPLGVLRICVERRW